MSNNSLLLDFFIFFPAFNIPSHVPLPLFLILFPIHCFPIKVILRDFPVKVDISLVSSSLTVLIVPHRRLIEFLTSLRCPYL